MKLLADQRGVQYEDIYFNGMFINFVMYTHLSCAKKIKSHVPRAKGLSTSVGNEILKIRIQT